MGNGKDLLVATSMKKNMRGLGAWGGEGFFLRISNLVDHVWQSQVENEHYSTVSGLI